MEYTPLALAVFLCAAFVAAVIAGLAGFAFALVAAAIWLMRSKVGMLLMRRLRGGQERAG